MLSKAKNELDRRLNTLKEIEEVLSGFTVSGNRTVSPQRRIKIPRIKLLEFDGDIKEWATFKSTFYAAVDSQNLSEIEKFTYLLTVLKGPVKELVRNYAVTPQNYCLVLELLEKHYGQSERLRACL